MITALIIAGSVLGYIAIAGVTHGVLRWAFKDSRNDDPDCVVGAVFWPVTPFAWSMYKVGTLISNWTSGLLEGREEKKLQRTQHRIQEIRKTRVDLRTAQEELREAEEELERELRENGR